MMPVGDGEDVRERRVEPDDSGVVGAHLPVSDCVLPACGAGGCVFIMLSSRLLGCLPDLAGVPPVQESP